MCLGCCWPFADVYLEDPPPKEPEPAEKKEYIVVDEPAVFYPIGAPQQAHYASPPQPQYQAPEPAPYTHWHGSSKAEIDQQNINIAQATGATKPVQLVPYKPEPGQQWWCRETDGTFTLRTANDIMENAQPGFWQYAHPGGYPYWIRQNKV
ncbi:hypothetical protein MMC20_001205 [Loxospora ochrophaea]|nr:hypothetical protein [Loxospora ochrophaea]